METEDGQSLLLRRLNTLLSRVGDFWLRRSYFQQIALVLVLLLAKNAFDIELRNIQEAYLPGAQEFPQAVGYFSASFGQVIIAYGLGVTTTTQWVVLHAVLIAVSLGVAFYLISKADPERRSFMILVLASATATSSLFISIGKYDVITYLGAVILALARTLPGAAVGAFIMASGNPEQSIVAGLALLAVSGASELKHLRLRSLVTVALSALTWVIVQLWFDASGMSTGRLELIPDFLAESFSQVVAHPGISVWSWLNTGWLFVLAFVLILSRASLKWVLLGLVAIPALVTVITADGGRVFGMVVLPAYLAVAFWFASRVFAQGRGSRLIMGIFALVFACLPIVLASSGWLYGLVFGFLL